MSLPITLYLGVLIFSFIITSVAIIPFINFLFKIKFRRHAQITRNIHGHRLRTFDELSNWKAGTPVGGGLLVIVIVSILFFILFPAVQTLGFNIHSAHNIWKEIFIIFFTFGSFGILGFYDDLLKFFRINIGKRKFFGLRFWQKFAIQWLIALIIGWLLYSLGIHSIHIPSTEINLNLGWIYIVVAAFIIVMFTNAYNITDGLDGLSTGLLMICLFAFWALSSTELDTILSLFISLWLGAIVAFLYFNVFPARIYLGDVGALSFGATLAVVGLLLGKPIALFVIGAIFLAEGFSSFVQIMSRRIFKRRVLPAAPFHLTLQKAGWEEPKVVFRAWLAGIMLSIFGLWLSSL